MATRLELQTLLQSITANVYYQPPASVKMMYPCILYERSDIDTQFADNKPYSNKKRYKLTVIDSNPDSIIPDAISQLQMSKFDRHYTADNLNHDVFSIYF